MPKKILGAAAVLYFILAAFWLLTGFILATVGLVERTFFSMLLGLWDACVALAYVAIGVGLVFQAPRAKAWGLWSAVISIPLVLITGRVNAFTIFAASLYLIIIILLAAEKLSTRTRDEEVLPSGRLSRWHD